MSGRIAMLREPAKLLLRKAAGRTGLSIGRDPFAARVARTLRAFGVATVLDVGANEGQYASLLRASGYDGTIVSYEPVRDAYERLERRAAKDASWSAVRAGLGEVAGKAEINVSANSYSSSILPITDRHVALDPTSAYQRTEPVELRTVDDEMARLGLSPASVLLKIDTQGYEEPVLRGAAGTLARLAAVQLELSLVEVYDGQALAEDLTARITGTGFELWSLDPGISDAEGRLLQYDALFVNASAQRS